MFALVFETFPNPTQKLHAWNSPGLDELEEVQKDPRGRKLGAPGSEAGRAGRSHPSLVAAVRTSHRLGESSCAPPYLGSGRRESAARTDM